MDKEEKTLKIQNYKVNFDFATQIHNQHGSKTSNGEFNFKWSYIGRSKYKYALEELFKLSPQ